MLMPRRAALAAGLTAMLALAACAGGTPMPQDVRQALAPSGSLRVAVYAGSPTSMVRAEGSDDLRGVALELGRELARRLDVPAQIVIRQRAAEVVDEIKSGRADFTLANATPARAQDVDFTPPLLALELGYLSLPGSPVQSLADVQRPGVRVGVSRGSTSQAVLGQQLGQASVVPVPDLQAAGQMLQRREIDAFATNKAILFELSDRVPGARVLDGRWGLEQLAIAVPKGRDVARDVLQRFAADVKADGTLQRAVERAGLRGVAALP